MTGLVIDLTGDEPVLTVDLAGYGDDHPGWDRLATAAGIDDLLGGTHQPPPESNHP